MNSTQRNLTEGTALAEVRSALRALAPDEVIEIAAGYLIQSIRDGLRSEYVAHALNVDGISAERIRLLLEA